MTAPIDGMQADDPESVKGHFVAPRGLSSVVKHFFAKAEVGVYFGHHLSKVVKEGEGKIKAETQVIMENKNKS